MIYVSTYPLPKTKLIDFAEQNSDKDIGYELFYDSLEFYSADMYSGRLKQLIESRAVSMHCPMEDCDLLADGIAFEKTIERHKRCFELAKEIAAPYVVIHPNSLERFDKKQTFHRRYILNDRMYFISGLAKAYGLKIYLENVGAESCGSLMVNIDDYAFLSDSDAWGMLLDTGHANWNGWDIPALINKLGGKLKAFHIHDNDGLSDSHSPIGNGTINWTEVFSAIKAMPRKPDIIVEYGLKSADRILSAVELINEKLR